MVANKTSVQSYTSVPLHAYLSLFYASSLIQIKDGQQELCWEYKWTEYTSNTTTLFSLLCHRGSGFHERN